MDNHIRPEVGRMISDYGFTERQVSEALGIPVGNPQYYKMKFKDSEIYVFTNLREVKKLLKKLKGEEIW